LPVSGFADVKVSARIRCDGEPLAGHCGFGLLPGWREFKMIHRHAPLLRRLCAAKNADLPNLFSGVECACIVRDPAFAANARHLENA
jgi:hypothetical protein